MNVVIAQHRDRHPALDSGSCLLFTRLRVEPAMTETAPNMRHVAKQIATGLILR